MNSLFTNKLTNWTWCSKVQNFAIIGQLWHAISPDKCMQLAWLISHFVERNESFPNHAHTWSHRLWYARQSCEMRNAEFFLNFFSLNVSGFWRERKFGRPEFWSPSSSSNQRLERSQVLKCFTPVKHQNLKNQKSLTQSLNLTRTALYLFISKPQFPNLLKLFWRNFLWHFDSKLYVSINLFPLIYLLKHEIRVFPSLYKVLLENSSKKLFHVTDRSWLMFYPRLFFE